MTAVINQGGVTGPWPLQGAIPQPARNETIVISPSGDITGAADYAAIQQALSTEAAAVELLAGSFYVSQTIQVPAAGKLTGAGPLTILSFTGSGDCLRWYNPVAPSGNYATQDSLAGQISGLIIDGASAASGSCGIHMGDMLAPRLERVLIRNFTGAGATGLHVDNTIAWLEKARFDQIEISNCATCCLIEQTGGSSSNNSMEYNWWDLHCYCESGQAAVVVQGGVYLFENLIKWSANMNAGSGPFLTLQGSNGAAYSQIQNSLIAIQAEAFGTNVQTISYGAAGNVINNCFGQLIFRNTWTPSNAAAGQCSLRGIVSGDSALLAAQGTAAVTTPGVPVSGAAQQNTSTAVVAVYVSGGTVSQITVGSHNTGLTSGCFLLPPGQSITITYTAAPSWTWVRAAT